MALEFVVQTGKVFWKHAAALGEQHPDAFIKAAVPMRHGPVGGALIQKDGAKPNEPRMDDLVHRTRLCRLWVMCDAAVETRFKQRSQRRPAEVPGEIALLGTPKDSGSIEFPHSGSDHGAAQRASAEPRKYERIGLAIEHGVDVYQLDAPARQFGPISGLTHVGLGAKRL